MLLHHTSPLRQVGARRVGRRLGENRDGAERDIDGEQAQAEEPAQALHTRVLVPAAPRAEDGEPHLIRDPQAVHGLQNEFEGKGQFEFRDHHHRGCAGPQADDIAAMDFALDLETERFEMRLDRPVKRGLGDGANVIRHVRLVA